VTFATAETAAAVPEGRAVIAPGTAAVAVHPRDRRSSPSIGRALRVARAEAVPLAVSAARRAATVLAASAGLRLGALFSVAEVRRPYEDFTLGTFDTGGYCGIVRRAVVRRDVRTGRRRAVGHVRRRTCYFPSRLATAFRVTYLPAVSEA
jgi:hypothetical protein